MPIRVCASPRCPNPAVYRGRCSEHARSHDRTINRAGYHVYRTAKWRHTRNRYLHDNPLCAHCGDIATDVHHITDLADGGNPYDFAGLQSLCHPCHSQHTRQSQNATNTTP